MSDVFTKEKRSEVMSRIKGKENKDTELALIKILRKNHITGWRRKQDVLGKPDFVFPTHKVALFVDGCFWHMCPRHFNMPKNNRAFWGKKLNGNRDRDRYVTRNLQKMGWRVIRIWEHELSKSEIVARHIVRVLQTRIGS